MGYFGNIEGDSQKWKVVKMYHTPLIVVKWKNYYKVDSSPLRRGKN